MRSVAAPLNPSFLHRKRMEKESIAARSRQNEEGRDVRATLVAVKKAAFTAACLFCAFAMAGAARAHDPAAVTFPGTAERLQDGDIILDTAPNVSNFLISDLGRPSGKYAHANVYVIIPGEGGRLVSFDNEGVHITGVRKAFKDDDYLALLRLRRPPPPGRLAASLATLQHRRLAFDYAMRWPDIDSDKTYCAGFVSLMYRLAGLPDPFPRSFTGRKEAGDDWLAQHLGIDPSNSVSPSAPLFLSQFKLVAQYQNSDKRIADKAAISEALAGKIKDYLTQRHLVPVVPGLGDKLVLALVNTGIFDADDIPLEALPPRQRRVVLAVIKYTFMVESRVERTLYLNGDEDWGEKNIAALTDRVADGYRDSYFVKEAPP